MELRKSKGSRCKTFTLFELLYLAEVFKTQSSSHTNKHNVDKRNRYTQRFSLYTKDKMKIVNFVPPRVDRGTPSL